MSSAKSVQKTFALDRDNLLRIYDGEGMRLTPASGVLWITEEQSANDTVLLPGETHQLEAPGLAVVQAHRAARVLLELPAGTAAPRRVDFALKTGAVGRRVAFPRPRRAFLDGWLGALVGAIRKAFVHTDIDGSNHILDARNGSSRARRYY